jgi:hypothetical protein
VRDLDKEQEQILNGNRFVVNTDESVGVFMRDTDKLFRQYRNLRVSVFNTYKGYLQDKASQEELMSYIDEQFIKLIKEYDPQAPVDFPGYVKNKLHQRVKHSYVRATFRNNQRIFVPRNDFDVTNLIDRDPVVDEQLDYYETLEYVLSDVKLTYMERDILFLMLQELNDTEIEQRIREKYKRERLSSSYIRDTLKEVQDFIRTKLQEAMERD